MGHGTVFMGTPLFHRGTSTLARIQLDVAAPDFTLTDPHGSAVSLSSFRDRSHVVLVFNRGFT